MRLDQEGFTVYAGCLDNNGSGKEELVRSCSNRLHTLQLDVSNEVQIREAVAEVKNQLQLKGKSIRSGV